LIDGAAGQEVVRGNEHRVGNGDDRLFVPPVAEHTSVARTKRTVSRADRGEGRLDEGRAEPAATRAGLARLVFPGALVVARAQPRPTRDVAGRGEDPHVQAKLGDKDLSRPLIDSRNRIQPGSCLRERGDDRLDPLAPAGHGLVKIVEMREELTHEKGVMSAKSSGQCLAQGRQFRAQPSTCQIGQDVRRPGTCFR
jgi:hypothetical protein